MEGLSSCSHLPGDNLTFASEGIDYLFLDTLFAFRQALVLENRGETLGKDELGNNGQTFPTAIVSD